MLLLPIEDFTLRSRLSERDLVKRLQEYVQSDRPAGESARPYFGKVDLESFEIRRAISYRNDFLPKISGEIFTDLGGTKVKVSMRVSAPTAIFMMLWIGGVSIACALAIVSWVKGDGFEFKEAIPFGMLSIGIAVVLAGFKIESSRSKRDLQEILDADMIA